MQRPPVMANATSAGLAALARPGRCFILGTASPARRAVLADLARENGFEFSVLTADLDEKSLGLAARAAGDAHALVLELAAAKADALADKLDADSEAATSTPPVPALLITADQVVTGGQFKAEIREKPVDTPQAMAWLREYRTHPPSTVSGLTVTAWPSRARASGVHVASVVFKEGGVPEEALEAAAAAAAGCAGGLRVEGPAGPFIEDLVGGRDSVFGLPVGLLLELVSAVDRDGGV